MTCPSIQDLERVFMEFSCLVDGAFVEPSLDREYEKDADTEPVDAIINATAYSSMLENPRKLKMDSCNQDFLDTVDIPISSAKC